MNIPNYTERQIEILRLLRDKVVNEEKLLIDQTLNHTLSPEDVDAVLSIILGEFVSEGTNRVENSDDFTANKYGWELEDLIDAVNRPRLVQSSLPKPDEELLIGMRVRYLTEYQFKKVTFNPQLGATETLYRDPNDGRFWEFTPHSGPQNEGPPQLRHLTTDEARQKYGVEVIEK